MHKKLREKISYFIAKNPSYAVLMAILVFNVLFFSLAALAINHMAAEAIRQEGFWASIYYTVTMILDAGCISYVIEDIGQVRVGLVIVCLSVVIIGMITFTGAMIGYVTNSISQFIENSNTGRRRLHISNHVVIINWNSRASEIVNDLLFSETRQTVVVLVPENREQVFMDIDNRLKETIGRNEKEIDLAMLGKPFWVKWRYKRAHQLKNNVSVIVRQGDIFSLQQLYNISVDKAKDIIILGNDLKSGAMKSGTSDSDHVVEGRERRKGNSNIIKSLILVSDMTSDELSADNQHIVVEVEDEWTLGLVNQVIERKERLGKCNIIAVPVDRILGQILSQFSLMPELNNVYSELFSNRGMVIDSRKVEETPEQSYEYIEKYVQDHERAIPLAIMDTKEGHECFFMTDKEASIDVVNENKNDFRPVSCKLNPAFWLTRKNIIILGHNSKMDSIMKGFDAFRNEWNFRDGSEILNIVLIDEEEILKRHNYYRDYPYVKKVVAADIFDKEIIYKEIIEFSDSNDLDTSILILSDDRAPQSEIDEKVLTYLIYVDDIIQQKKKKDPNFNVLSMDTIVEVLNPQNYDVIRSYSVENVIISNRYISRMITQIGQRDAIFDFYTDILTYDDSDVGDAYASNELYIKVAGDFFEELPGTCKASDLVRTVFEIGPENNKSVLLGYIPETEDRQILFAGDCSQMDVTLNPKDKLIIFTNH